MRVLVVDHYDSYAWNLVHLVAAVSGSLPDVVEHDRVEASVVDGYSHVVLSPGPGSPDDPGSFAVGREILLRATRPVLGVCLGLQGLVTAYGGAVSRVTPAHGDVARIRHDGRGVFVGLPQDFAAVRYHSLAAVGVPAALEVSAHSEDGVVMGVRHRALPLEGVQFHPESILSEHGAQMVRTFLTSARGGGLM